MNEATDFMEELLDIDSEFTQPEWEEAEVRRGGRGRPSRARQPSGRQRRPSPPSRRPSRTSASPRRPRSPRRPMARSRSSRYLPRKPPITSGAEPCTCPAQDCPQHGSEYVRWVQSSLNQIQGLNLPVNGIMNVASRSALRRFQEQLGLAVDGIAGPEVKQALIEAKANLSSQNGEKEELETQEANNYRGSKTEHMLMSALRGNTQLDEIAWREELPWLNNQNMSNLEMNAANVSNPSHNTCIKSFTVGNFGFGYSGHNLSNSQKNLISNIAQEIFGNGGQASPLSQAREVSITGYSSGTANLEMHANKRAVSVFEELRKRLLELGATSGVLNKKITFGHPVTQQVISQAASDPNFRKVEICLVKPTRDKPSRPKTDLIEQLKKVSVNSLGRNLAERRRLRCLQDFLARGLDGEEIDDRYWQFTIIDGFGRERNCSFSGSISGVIRGKHPQRALANFKRSCATANSVEKVSRCLKNVHDAILCHTNALLGWASHNQALADAPLRNFPECSWLLELQAASARKTPKSIYSCFESLFRRAEKICT